MGNSSESVEVDTYNHPRLGPIKRIQESNSNQCIGYELVIENQKIYDEWLKELRLIKTEESVDEILFLPLAYTFKQTAYCGTGGIASLRYEDYLYSLLPEILNRREIKRPFNEQQLLYLFYNLVKVSSLLEQRGRVVGDIKPENILVNEDGYIKIVSQLSWPGQPSKYVRGWEKANERLFLSPEQCEERHRKKQAIIYSTPDSCSQAFSIALTILQAGTLRDCSEVYGDTHEYKFSEVKVRQILDIFQTRYSSSFSEIIREMLHPSAKRRWKAEPIYKLLKPYEYQILNLQEIGIQVDNSLFLPKIEREEKISIKKMGDSHQLLDMPRENSESRHPKNSYISEASSPTMKASQPHLQNHSPYNSNTHFARDSSSHHLPPLKMQGSTYHPEAPPNYQLVNEHTNFARQPQALTFNPLPPQQSPHTHMSHSLPLHLSNYNQSNAAPQYITQNSMIVHLGQQHDTTYALGNPRGHFPNY